MSKGGRIVWTNAQRRLGDLVPWPRNPRQIREAEAERLRDSVDTFGQVETLAVGPGNEIYNGHQRLNVLVAQHGPDYEVDVRVASRALTEKEREKLTVYLHKGAAGEWNFDALANEFDVDELLEWGFADWELGIDAGAIAGDVDAEPQVDRAEELRQEWGVETGQLWQLGAHRLICGDCTDAAVVERVLDGAKPLLMVTDPPYGVEYDANWRNEAAAEGKLAYAARRIRRVDNDDRADWSDAFRLFPGDVAYTWSAGGDHVIITGQAIQAAGYEIRNQIIWVKPHFPISRGHYTYQHEQVWYAVRKGATAHWIGEANESTTWHITLDKNVDGGHSTQKPLECMERPIRNHEGDVYDPFVGSGTTIIAAEREGRRCFAIDIDPAYVAVALQRYLDASGVTPHLVEAA